VRAARAPIRTSEAGRPHGTWCCSRRRRLMAPIAAGAFRIEADAMARPYEELVSLLRRLGARDAESWARSEVDEGIPQLLRFLVLRGMWKGVIEEDETNWIEAHIASAKRDPNAPLSGVGGALQRLLTSGAEPADLSELVRGMQYETLFHIAYLLDDPVSALDDVRTHVPELEDVAWGLWEEGDEERPSQRIGGLHESALETDPTGREMRPAPPKR